MSAKVAAATMTRQDALGVIGRPKPAKVTLDDAQPDSRVSELLLESLRITFGKIEAGAASVGKGRANFTRDLKKWADTLEELGPEFLARLGAGLLRDYGVALETPEQRAERIAAECVKNVDELLQVVRHLARTA